MIRAATRAENKFLTNYTLKNSLPSTVESLIRSDEERLLTETF
jgi:hypothetical protein